MIYFLEYDTAGNVVHIMGDPSATMTPVVNRITFMTPAVPATATSPAKPAAPMVDATGQPISPLGFPLCDPVAITKATFDAILAGGTVNFTYDATTQTVTQKASDAK